VLFGAVRCSAALRGAVRCCAVLCDAMRCCAGAVLCCAVLCGAEEYMTEFSMWAISASPLTVTTPIMNCTSASPNGKVFLSASLCISLYLVGYSFFKPHPPPVLFLYFSLNPRPSEVQGVDQ
jgi:hypothetical protein